MSLSSAPNHHARPLSASATRNSDADPGAMSSGTVSTVSGSTVAATPTWSSTAPARLRNDTVAVNSHGSPPSLTAASAGPTRRD